MEEAQVTLQAGQPAPEFDLPTDGGGCARLADFKGNTLVLYFYPKDDTPGCTLAVIARLDRAIRPEAARRCSAPGSTSSRAGRADLWTGVTGWMGWPGRAGP
jgi:hypothetical protein